MKLHVFLIALSIPFFAQSLEYEIQTENEQVRVSKIKLSAGEEVGLHRDELPRVVIALKGGIIKRLEEDGSINEVQFPTGEAVFLEADPIGQMHRGVNSSDSEIEIFVIELKTK